MNEKMISIQRRFLFIDLIDNFLEEEFKPKLTKKKLIIHHYSKVPAENFFKEITYHLCLERVESEILESMTKMNRYMLRRAKKEPYEVVVKDHPTDEELNEFQKFYNQFVKIKQTRNINRYRLNRLKRLRDQGVVVFTKLQNTNGEALCYRIYIKDKEMVLNFYTCTAAWIRNRPDLKQQIRFANRYLLWENMMLFKKRGYKIYDYGGITDIEEINKFKEDFGFKGVEAYHGFETDSIFGKILVRLHWRKKIYLFS